ncbi:hypothetical protein J1N35_007783 [Gossypium stocksii]|uniref:Uncharacterized protein n=1 Tax=Gossypium stocksii TaxID=47602 RepID=A0A9D4AFW5_9ROSI|nr:hypothetical protein J1N35_007783 [Gossypium stocksii]
MIRFLIIDSSLFSYAYVLSSSRTFMGEEASSNKVMVLMPAKNELIAPAPKFKQRKVSAVRDFPPRCSRVAAPNFGSSKQIIVD